MIQTRKYLNYQITIQITNQVTVHISIQTAVQITIMLCASALQSSDDIASCGIADHGMATGIMGESPDKFVYEAEWKLYVPEYIHNVRAEEYARRD